MLWKRLLRLSYASPPSLYRYRASRHTSEAQSRDCAWRTRGTSSCEQLEIRKGEIEELPSESESEGEEEEL